MVRLSAHAREQSGSYPPSAGRSHEAGSSGNVYAELLMMHFYRWLTSGTALLYDPALQQLVYGLMRKVFLQLLGELKRLGATVVFANFNRIILTTNKHSREHAAAYAAFLVKTVKAKSLFSWLEIEPAAYWETLHWMDDANFAGVLAGQDSARAHRSLSARADGR